MNALVQSKGQQAYSVVVVRKQDHGNYQLKQLVTQTKQEN